MGCWVAELLDKGLRGWIAIDVEEEVSGALGSGYGYGCSMSMAMRVDVGLAMCRKKEM